MSTRFLEGPIETGEVQEFLSGKQELQEQIFQSDANLILDPQAKTLTVEIHGLRTPRDDAALEHLCAELTATETKYPGTDLRLIYRKVSR